MLDLASHIVKTKTGHFEPSKFEDQYARRSGHEKTERPKRKKTRRTG
jgi:non-homologous end joining protein Ku